MTIPTPHASFDDDWSPENYLEEFYAPGRIGDDEREAIKAQIHYARTSLRGDPVALEFGSGPTLHRAIAMAPYVSEIHVADYLPRNLEAVQRWVLRQPGRHDWDSYVVYALQCEGVENPTSVQVAERKAMVRARITRFIQADAGHPQPLGEGNASRYSHVYSGFCADSATSDKATWVRFMRNIASLVAPGGTFWTAALRNTDFYTSGPHRFPSANVTEDEMRSVLRLDFRADSVHVEGRDLPSMRAHGFEGVILAHATKDAPASQRRGMESLGRVDEEGRRLLQSAFDLYRADASARHEMIHWVSLYLNGEFTRDHPLKSLARDESLRGLFHEWVIETVARAYRDWPEHHVLAYGFVANPAGNPNYQAFHCDYNETCSSLFVPLTPVTTRNAVQFIREPLQRARFDANIEFGDLERLMEAEGCDALEVSQLICRPFTLLRLLPHTPHRGIPNTDDYDRVLFFILVDSVPFVLGETAHYQYSTKGHGPVDPSVEG